MKSCTLFSSPTPTIYLPKPRPKHLLVNNIPLKTSSVSAIINLPPSVILTCGSGASVLVIFGESGDGDNGCVVQWDVNDEELSVDDLEGRSDHRGYCRGCMVGEVKGAVDFRALRAKSGVNMAMRELCPPDYFDLDSGAYRLGCVESKDYTDEELRAEEEIMGRGEMKRDSHNVVADDEEGSESYFAFKVPSWPLLVVNGEGEKPDLSLKEYLKNFEAPVRSEIMMAGALSTFCFLHMAKNAERAAGDFGWFYSQAIARSDYYYLKCLSTSLRVLSAAFSSKVDSDAIILGISGREVLGFIGELRDRIRPVFVTLVEEIDEELMGLLGGPEGHVGVVARSMGIPLGGGDNMDVAESPTVVLQDGDTAEETLEALGFYALAKVRRANEDLLMLAARVLDDEKLDYCRGEAESLLLQFDASSGE